MNTKQLKSVLTNPDIFAKALNEDLENALKNSNIIKGEIMMAKRYGRVNTLSKYIKNLINEAEEVEVTDD